jgi:hypothetical protein
VKVSEGLDGCLQGGMMSRKGDGLRCIRRKWRVYVHRETDTGRCRCDVDRATDAIWDGTCGFNVSVLCIQSVDVKHILITLRIPNAHSHRRDWFVMTIGSIVHIWRERL